MIAPAVVSSRAYGFGELKPLDLAAANLTRITVCTRPFRPAGPRRDTEIISGKRIVHNYGHGGSGWSLAWGEARRARHSALADGAREVAVLGAGAMGLTTAITLAEAGARVTIYARDMPMESRSARATGVWSPSSRIGFADAVKLNFSQEWAAIARFSYARHLTYVGRSGASVEFTPRFYVRSGRPEPQLASEPENAREFLELGRSLRGLTPPWSERKNTPFNTPYGVRGGLVMTFNIAEYTRQLVEDLHAMGGRIVRADIRSPDEMAVLPGDAVVNCTGYDARVLMGEDTLIPVRGQIAWMAPQTDRPYGVHHRGVTALSRRDGLLIQESGGTDYFGYGVEREEPDADEFRAALAKVAGLFETDA